ncbi:MAG: AsmA family protein [Lautropia sp.]
MPNRIPSPPGPAAAASAPAARPSRRRRWPWAVAALALPIAFVIASDLAGWRYLRGPLQSVAGHFAGRAVTIDAPLRLHLLRAEPTLAVGGFRLAAPQWSSEPHFAASGPLAAAVRWRDLLGWRREPAAPLPVVALSVQRLDIRIERRADGRASWQFGDHEARPADAGTTPVLPAIGRLELSDGRIVVHDELLPLELDATATLREGAAVADAGVAIDARGRYRGQPIEIAATAPGLLPLASGGALERLSGRARIGETRLRFDGRIGQPVRLLDVAGNFELAGPSLAELGELPGVTLPATEPYSIEGWLARGADRIELRVKAAAVGDSRLAGEFAFDPTTTPPRLSGRLTGSKLQLQDLGPAVGADAGGHGKRGDPNGGAKATKADPKATRAKATKADPKATKAGGQAAGASGDVKKDAGARTKEGARAKEEDAREDARARVLPQRPLDLPSMKQMDADVTVALARFDPGTAAISAMTNLRGRIVLQGGVLEIRDLDTRVAGGRIAGGLRIAPTGAEKVADWNADLRWWSIDLAEWLRQTPQRRFVVGRFDGMLKLAGRGASTAAMLASLDGEIRGAIRDGRLSHQLIELIGLDAAQALGVTVRGDDLLDVRCALVDFAARDGRLRSRAGIIDTVDTTIFADGTIGLDDESLQLRLVAAPKDWSPLSLRSPVTVGGTFGAPDIGIDARPLALKALASLALATVAPIAAILPLMDFGKERGDVCVDSIERARRGGGAAAGRERPSGKQR